MKTLLLAISILVTTFGFSQTWSDDVATIFYNKCGQCHHNGGIAPFSLMTYNEVGPMASFIYNVVDTEEMPPWPPNNDYQQYSHDRSLSSNEKATVLNWINNGALEGNAANTPPPPVYQTGSILGNGDLEIQIPTYMSKAQGGNDDYACFAIPSNLPTDRHIKSIEIVPGNREIVHHALIYIDPTSSCVTDTVGGDCGGPSSSNATLVMGYTPGSSPLTLPASSPLKLGMPMPANSQVVFAMHYPDGSYGQYDSTKVIFHFYPPGTTGIRDVTTAPVLQNWSFFLPANQITSVSAQYPNSGGLPANFSILSVFPHMHLLGQSMKVFGLNAANDTVNQFIDIPEWDFHWQDFYFFKNIQKASTGTTLKVDAVYDNTSGNIHNPNNPPQAVVPGLNTTDEMCLVYAHYMLYLPGDENYNLDSLMALGFDELSLDDKDDLFFSAYPNPFDNSLNLYSNSVKVGDIVSVSIFDMNGKKVTDLIQNITLSEDELHIVWDGSSQEGSAHSGMYFVSINVNGEFLHQRIIKR